MYSVIQWCPKNNPRKQSWPRESCISSLHFSVLVWIAPLPSNDLCPSEMLWLFVCTGRDALEVSRQFTQLFTQKRCPRVYKQCFYFDTVWDWSHMTCCNDIESERCHCCGLTEAPAKLPRKVETSGLALKLFVRSNIFYALIFTVKLGRRQERNNGF